MRSAVVTGAARGLGAAVALRLAVEGWQVLALDACTDDVSIGYPLATPGELSAVVERGEGRIVGRQLDVRDPSALAAAVHWAESEFGGLDAAVASAALIGGGAPLWQTPDAVRDAIWAVDVAGTWNLAAAAVPAMLRRPPPAAAGSWRSPQPRASGAAHPGGLLRRRLHPVVGMVRALAQDLPRVRGDASRCRPARWTP